jgi:hypothetical protein
MFDQEGEDVSSIRRRASLIRLGPGVFFGVLALAAPAPAHAHARVKDCGTVGTGRDRTRVLVLRGTDCATARSVAGAYVAFQPLPGAPGWACALAHGGRRFRGHLVGFACGKGGRSGDIERWPHAFLGVLDRDGGGGGGGGSGGGGGGGSGVGPTGPSGSIYTGSGPPAPASAGCITRVTIVGREIWSPCLRQDGNRYRASTWVRVGGVDYTPVKGTEVTVSTGGQLSARGRLSVRTSGTGLPHGTLALASGRLDTDLNHQRAFSLQGESPITVGGLPASRAAGLGLAWTGKGAELTLSLEVARDVFSLIDPFRPLDARGPTLQNGFGLEAKLTTSNNTGLVLDEVTASVKRATAFSVLALQDVTIAYRPQEREWSGSATVIPFRSGPLARAALGTWSGEVAITIDPVSLRKVALTARELNKPIGASGVFLQTLGGELTTHPHLVLAGTIGLSFGPTLDVPLLGDGISAVSADGRAELTMGPWIVKGSGSMTVVRQTLADGSFTLDFSSGSATVAGHMDVSLLGNGFDGRLGGWVAGGRGFQIDGGVRVKLLGHGVADGEGIVSDAGIGACAHLPSPFLPDFGWRYRWGDTLPTPIASSCDIGPLRTRPAAARAAAAAGGFTVPRHQRGWVVRLHAATGAAAVVLRSPSGTTTALPATQPVMLGPRVAAVRDEATGDLWVVLGHPRGGRWTVTPLPAAAPIAAIDSARVLPAPAVHAAVSGPDRYGRRTLRWRARRIPGQRLVFVERGPGGFARVLASTRQARGHVRFDRADTWRGWRSVFVQVVQGGGPRAGFRVARFIEHRQGPGRPRHVSARRRGRLVTLRWGSAPGAAAYRVDLRLRDGRQLTMTVGPRRHHLVLRGATRHTAGQLSVRVLSGAGLAGPAASARLR